MSTKMYKVTVKVVVEIMAKNKHEAMRFAECELIEDGAIAATSLRAVGEKELGTGDFDA